MNAVHGSPEGERLNQSKLIRINAAGMSILLSGLGLDTGNILRLANLPDDLLSRENVSLTTDEYFRFWEGIQKEGKDPLLPIKIVEAYVEDAFDPPLFAAICSPNLNIALKRISRYKRLVSPQVLDIKETRSGTSFTMEWLDKTIEPPGSLLTMELAFFVQLARKATRTFIKPLKVVSPIPPLPASNYTEFFGVEVSAGKSISMTFSSEDAAKPFLTANNTMWEYFEPELKRRLAQLDKSATMTERVRASLLELIPSGNTTIDSVAHKLRVSTRTLQRRLKEEGNSFQAALNKTREKLALHYLKNSTMSGAEISFLLGFEEPASFFRAFHNWTGKTPNSFRIDQVKTTAYQ